MKKGLFAFAAIGALANGSLSARELLCEQCLPEPDCWEHLFVERCQWFVHGEFLYWGVAEGNLDYALTVKNAENSFLTVVPREYKIADFDFCPGFRVAASYYNCPKYWEVTAQYTWMQNSGKDRASSTDNVLLATRMDFGGAVASSASSDLELDYQLGDLYAARVFDPNPHLRMRLYGGVTLGYLKQEFEVAYAPVAGLSTIANTYDSEWCFFGGGFRLGVTADWFWGCQFYLTGRVSFATLYGGYEQKLFESGPGIGDDPVVLVNTKYDDPRFAFHTQFMMGPSWQIPCDCWSFELFAGYEMNLWFNLNEEVYFDEGLPGRSIYYQSVLGLHGLTLRLTLGW